MDRSGFLAWFTSDVGKAVIAGALGGIVRWLTLRPSWREGVATLVVGAICAAYLGPIALPLVEHSIGKLVPAGDMKGPSAFLVGIGGISLSGLVLDIFDRRRAALKKEGKDA